MTLKEVEGKIEESQKKIQQMQFELTQEVGVLNRLIGRLEILKEQEEERNAGKSDKQSSVQPTE